MKSFESIAKVCHEANKAYCEELGDFTQVSWEDAPEWQRQSAVAGVRFHVANPDALPSASHEQWLRGKIADGWGYGPLKDSGKKEHPCCVPFRDLPREQQIKDSIFKAIVYAIVHSDLV